MLPLFLLRQVVKPLFTQMVHLSSVVSCEAACVLRASPNEMSLMYTVLPLQTLPTQRAALSACPRQV